jgi:hypothetical protein
MRWCRVLRIFLGMLISSCLFFDGGAERAMMLSRASLCKYGRLFCIFALDITTYDGIGYVHHLSEQRYRGLRLAYSYLKC